MICERNQRMRNSITLTHTKVQGKRVEYIYEVRGEWAKYFHTEENYFVEYSFPVERIKAAILVIPFLGNILPAAWLCDADVTVPICDEDFYYSLPKIREGFEQMYPGLRWNGTFTAEKIQKNRKKNTAGSLLLFSGGVDAYASLIRHKEELPDLCMIWGSDVPLTEHKGWTLLNRKAQKTAAEFDCSLTTVRSSFRNVLNTGRLREQIRETGESWWHGFQHGLALLCLAAPAAWQKGRRTVYIASSFTEEDQVLCGSDPRIDNQVRFFDARCVHDARDLSRKDKISLISSFSSRTHTKILPHVCWQTTSGINCGHCEKCWRTMLGFLSEKKNPKEFGFPSYRDMGTLGEEIARNAELLKTNIVPHFGPVQEAFRKNYTEEELPRSLQWLLKEDLSAEDIAERIAGYALQEDTDRTEKADGRFLQATA